MIVVADASPLIFLSKIRRLDLIRSLLGRDLRLPTLVRDEVLVPGLDPAEERELVAFLATCKVVSVRKPLRFATAMSRADDASLTLAIRDRADVLLCDERVTRRMAQAEGIRPVGTLGLLTRAARVGVLTPAAARTSIDTLIRNHGFRIGVAVYQAALSALDGTLQSSD